MGDAVRIRVDCPDCSEVRVTADEVTLRICVDDAHWTYWFTCPVCECRAAAPTRPGPALDAIAAGAPFETWRLPAELAERHDGPKLQLMDLVDLQLTLMRDDCVEALKQQTS